MQVTVLGAGSWGTTIATLLSEGNPTVLWARRADVADAINASRANPAYLPGIELPARLQATPALDGAVGRADVVVVAVPTKGFRSVLSAARAWIRPRTPVVSLTKGIEAGTLMRMTEVVAQVLPGHPAAALSGPNLAREIIEGQGAASVLATADPAVAAELQSLLQHRLLRVYRNHDVVGCEVGGALKNVIAIAAGIVEGLGGGDNTRAAVMTRGLAELTRLGVAMGAEPQTLAGLAGLGDLVATCTSPLSRNRSVGEMLGQGRLLTEILAPMRMVAEGVDTARSTVALSARYRVDMPICREIERVVTGRQRAGDAYRAFQPAGHEFDPD